MKFRSEPYNWMENPAKHDVDTPGAQFGHETAENYIIPLIEIDIFIDGQSSNMSCARREGR